MEEEWGECAAKCQRLREENADLRIKLHQGEGKLVAFDGITVSLVQFSVDCAIIFFVSFFPKDTISREYTARQKYGFATIAQLASPRRLHIANTLTVAMAMS